MTSRAALALLLAAGCFEASRDEAAGSAESFDRYDDDDLPAGVCRDTGTDTDDPCDTDGTTIGDASDLTSTTTSVVSDQCMSSDDCPGAVCAAGWDASLLQRSPLDCQFECVTMLDDASWCGDDAACCDAAATCTARGYCLIPE